MKRDREDEDIQVVGVFVVMVVVSRLGAGAPQPPDGVPGRHQPREAVPSHSRGRYERIPRSLNKYARPVPWPSSVGTEDWTGLAKGMYQVTHAHTTGKPRQGTLCCVI